MYLNEAQAQALKIPAIVIDRAAISAQTPGDVDVISAPTAQTPADVSGQTDTQSATGQSDVQSAPSPVSAVSAPSAQTPAA